MVSIDIGNGDDHYFLKMEGHARNETESDPAVCAACSAIAYTLLGWALNNEFIEVRHAISDGSMYIGVDLFNKSCAIKWTTAAVFEAIEIGLRQIAQQYPQFVTVN